MSEGRKKRIALVGPVLPYRGGIAQHTTMLRRALAEKSELLTISFSRQYPAWLFPGESDKDRTYANHREPGVDYLLDSLNPLSWRRCAQLIIRYKPDALIVPWWTVYWAFCFHAIARRSRSAGVPVVFFCHNVIEHESAPWKRALTRWVLDTSDRFAVHTLQDKEDLLRIRPNTRVLVHPHPTYDQFPRPAGKLGRRADLELLFFGFVRPYKGLDLLIDALSSLNGQSIMLTIAGEFWSGADEIKQRIEQLGLADMVELRPRYHSEEETAELFARADVVVLPYRAATGSGIIPLAYHYGKPVIASRVGGLPDVVRDRVTGWLVAPGSSGDLAQAIASVSRDQALAMKADIEELAKALSWDGLSDALLDHIQPAPQGRQSR
jgi:glycosyltransferase involved in cell wall biosynthesis